MWRTFGICCCFLPLLATFADAQTSYTSACGTSIVFNFSSGVTAAQQTLLHDTTVSAVEYICRKTGYGVPQFQVFASTDDAELIRDLTGIFGYPASSAGSLPICAISPIGGILINVANTQCLQWGARDVTWRIARITAHEYFRKRLVNRSGDGILFRA